MDKVLLSTGKDDWETPKDFYKKLDDEFHFTLDPCRIFNYYAPSVHDSDDYRDVFDRVYKGEPFEKISEWNVVFLNKEDCEKYCEWKMEQEAKKDGN